MELEEAVASVEEALVPIKVKDELIVRFPKVPFNDNIDLYRQSLAQELSIYENLEVTSETLKDYEKAKRRVVAIRTALASKIKEAKVVLTSPWALFETRVKCLLNDIEAVESKMNENLNVFEEKRKESIRETIALQVEALQKQYLLSEKYFRLLDLGKKAFFNKTQDFTDTLNDIEGQFRALKFDETEQEKSVDRIKAMCQDALVPSEPFLKMFELTGSLTTVLDELEKLKVGGGEAESKSESESESELNTVVIEITYSKSQSELLNDFFKSNGITFKIINRRN